MKMDLSRDVAEGKLSPHIAALMERASAQRWVITTPTGWTGYYTEEHARRILAKHPECTLTPPEVV